MQLNLILIFLFPTKSNRCKSSPNSVVKWFPSTPILHTGPWRSLPNIIHLPVENTHCVSVLWTTVSPFFYGSLITSALLYAGKVQIVCKSFLARTHRSSWDIKVFIDLSLHLLITKFVSLPIFQHIWVFKIVRLVQDTLIGKEGGLGLETKFWNEARAWEGTWVLTVHIIIVIMHVASSGSWCFSP